MTLAGQERVSGAERDWRCRVAAAAARRARLVRARGPDPGQGLIARSLAALFLAGASGSVVWLLLPHTDQADEFWIWAATLGAYATGVVLIVGYDRLPMWALKAAVTMATIVITGRDPRQPRERQLLRPLLLLGDGLRVRVLLAAPGRAADAAGRDRVRLRADQPAGHLELGVRALAARDRHDGRRRLADPAADRAAAPALDLRARRAPARRAGRAPGARRSPTCCSAACCRRGCRRSRGVELGAAYRPGAEGVEVGGDFYDVFELPGGDWGLIIGDVRGKGPEAATVTALVRHTVRAAAVRESSPAAVLETVNSVMLRDSRRGGAVHGDLRAAGGATRRCACASRSAATRSRCCCAPTAVRRPVGDDRDAARRARQPAAVATPTIDLGPGDALVMVTDGVQDSRMPDGRLGEQRLVELVRSCRGHERGRDRGAASRMRSRRRRSAGRATTSRCWSCARRRALRDWPAGTFGRQTA